MLLRAMARLVGSLLMVVLALLGLGVAAYCVDGFIGLGSARPDRLLGLPAARRDVGHFLAQLATPGNTAGLALICGIGAILLGLLLLRGLLGSSKERLVVLDTDADGATLAARPRALQAMARVLAEQAPGITNVKRPKLTLSRRGTRGRLKVTASRNRTSEHDEVQRAVRSELEPITAPFNITPRVRVHAGQSGERVQ
jgi:hypothetical protein